MKIKIEDFAVDINHKYEKLVTMLAQLTSDLKYEQKNRRIEEPLINLKSGSGMFILGGNNNENSTNTRGKIKGNSKLLKIDFFPP